MWTWAFSNETVCTTENYFGFYRQTCVPTWAFFVAILLAIVMMIWFIRTWND